MVSINILSARFGSDFVKGRRAFWVGMSDEFVSCSDLATGVIEVEESGFGNVLS